MRSIHLFVIAAPLCLASLSAQTEPAATAPADPAVQVDKRVFGVLPNYRAADGAVPYAPITTRQKYMIGLKDSFDKPVYLLSAFYAGLGQLQNSNPDFGQGMKGFGNRYVRSLADNSVGNLMTEAFFPSLLKEDPRYFLQTHTGKSGRQRFSYALTRVVVTRTDNGGTRFNASEWLGNAVSVGLSNSYYPGPRTLGSNFSKLSMQIGVDVASNVMKEFWPDIKTRFLHR